MELKGLGQHVVLAGMLITAVFAGGTASTQADEKDFTESEAVGYPDRSGHSMVDQLEEHFQDLDRNRDGRLDNVERGTTREFLSALDRNPDWKVDVQEPQVNQPDPSRKGRKPSVRVKSGDRKDSKSNSPVKQVERQTGPRFKAELSR